ncbi:MAG: tRNA pseudouridine(13) synthase TruD [Phycisphaerae bacterium]|nr:tRNA pseudouridine(13) synthase TruD [Phycisphaerae bacterium]
MTPAAEPTSRDGADATTHVAPRRYLTGDIAGIGGVIRQRPEDFLVEEIPLYDPCGEGEHIYMLVEKREMSTLQLVQIVAAHFGVRRDAVGYAGLKDKHAITRQVISVHVPGKKPEDFPAFTHPRLGVVWTDLHTNKLRRGHLRGNRFSIRVRAVPARAVISADRVLRSLERQGVPNRLGEQRFGHYQNNHLIGRAIILGDWRGALDELLGPKPGAPDSSSAAREAYAAGHYEDALRSTSPASRAETTALSHLASGRTPEQAVRAIDRAAVEFYLSGFQSAVFNALLDERLERGELAALVAGDVAFKHDNHAMFAVDDATAAAPDSAERLRTLAISPTGPMWGPAMMRATGRVDESEVAALDRAGVTMEQLQSSRAVQRGLVEGARRAFRVPVIAPEAEGGGDEHGAYVRCAFELPRGAFATVVLREIMKPRGDELAREIEGAD